MTVLNLLLQSAEADLSYALWWFERTGDPEWQQLAINARRQADDFRLALAVPA